ncbi:UNKNOWN [Stylonychia lemnae]|uniref:Uncharacterized protein n=1 Tax=Stylonychia lemnae TaxID=5949 RepID=A0A078A7L6_STYLE|nr:UNKNOWN [Stylonychia lemnae]|eukprot:CDW77552.1 UNKNOWN [Stylonychia lemnae]
MKPLNYRQYNMSFDSLDKPKFFMQFSQSKHELGIISDDRSCFGVLNLTDGKVIGAFCRSAIGNVFVNTQIVQEFAYINFVKYLSAE